MKAGTAIGLGVGTGLLLLAAMMEGVSPTVFLAPSALLVIFGGTFGATMSSFGVEGMLRIPKLFLKALMADSFDKPAQVERLVGFADTARREGLLALESRIEALDDEFTRKGLQLVVDGSDEEVVRDILDLEIEGMEARHKLGEEVFRAASGFAPTMGVLGAVLGLVHALGSLDDPAALGPSIATAFIATLLGVGSANVLFLPIATRLKMLSEVEVEFRTMTLEGIIAVQAGDNPRMVAEKLLTYVAPAERAQVTLPGTPKLQAVGEQKAA